MRGWFVFSLVWMAVQAGAAAALTLALPEGGLYRPGEYLAVAVNGAGGVKELRVEADGALATIVRAPADRVVVPLLVVEPDLRNLHVVADAQRIAFDGTLRLAPESGRSFGSPSGSLISEVAYGPTFGWQPGWAWPLRRTALIGTAMFTLLAILAMSPRSMRWRLMGGAALILAGAGGAAWLWAKHPPVHTAQGVVLLSDGDRQQVDHWWYQTSPRAQEAAFIWREVTFPIFFSRGHRERLQMSLRAASDGQPIAFTYQLPAGGSIAFLARNNEQPKGLVLQPRQPSRIADMAQRLYRRPIGRSIAPPEDEAAEWFGGVELLSPP